MSRAHTIQGGKKYKRAPLNRYYSLCLLLFAQDVVLHPFSVRLHAQLTALVVCFPFKSVSNRGNADKMVLQSCSVLPLIYDTSTEPLKIMPVSIIYNIAHNIYTLQFVYLLCKDRTHLINSIFNDLTFTVR